ncbi:hypothetical protein [Methylocapsa aurea]|uniref:TubC N-terminal docking domain-related protein n=1 Tax=Methylocapsa aurea TaxID=663610 RepID=UPI000561CD07|nr:hypothetical protein [Methylocapsa aurea]
MSALTIIKEASACGVLVSLNGDRLALKAVAKPPADLLAKLREHKAAIVTLLRQAESPTPELGAAALEERAAAADGVPEPYRDAWARLQIQKPIGVSDQEWRQAIAAAGLFLDQWGSLAVQFEWSPGDLFDVPRDGETGGVIWFCHGEEVRSLGPEHAVTASGRVFDRLTRTYWQNPYHQKGGSA